VPHLVHGKGLCGTSEDPWGVSLTLQSSHLRSQGILGRRIEALPEKV
jgi:hypothetical protein